MGFEIFVPLLWARIKVIFKERLICPLLEALFTQNQWSCMKIKSGMLKFSVKGCNELNGCIGIYHHRIPARINAENVLAFGIFSLAKY